MAWIAPIAAALISAYGANKASKQANKRSSSEKLMEQLMMDQAQQTGVFGKDMLGRALSPMLSSQNFWQSVLHGNRESLSALYGNDIADLGTQSRQSFQTARELSPRSGISDEYLSSLPQQRAIQERRIMTSAKPQAATALGELGTNFASLGLSGLSQGRGGAQNLLDYSQGRREYAGQQGADTGAAIYSIIKAFGDAYSKRKTGSTGQSWWGNQAKTGSDTNNWMDAFGT